MAKLSSFKRITKENVPEDYYDLIDIIGPSINQLADEVTNAFNKDISIDDNLKMEYKEIELTPDEVGIPKNTTQYNISFNGRVRGVQCIKVDKSTADIKGSFTSLATTSILTCNNHNLFTGQSIVIAGSDCSPKIDGIWQVTKIDNNNISIPAIIQTRGTKGSFSITPYPINTPFISISQNNKTIKIEHVTGLQANNKYTLTLLTYG